MKVAVMGATGYSGVELIRFLLQHPFIQLQRIISHSSHGNELTKYYPHLSNIMTNTLDELNIEEIKKEIDILFFATPSGISKDLLPQIFPEVTCIDLSGDFRLNSAELYESWYKHGAAPEEVLQQATYGLSEIFSEEIKHSRLIANPGCYPTASLLALIPALKLDLIQKDSIIIDGKSGVSGAGRSASLATHYAEVNENVKAYKLGTHQHVPEIEQILEKVSGHDLKVSFSTHLIPMTRGIMCTIYTELKDYKSTAEIIQLYKEFYKNQPFMRIREEGQWPATKEVYGSNYCDLGFMADPRTNRLTIVSVIDNVVKGAAGQAIQNMNIIHGWDVKTGLYSTPIYP